MENQQIQGKYIVEIIMVEVVLLPCFYCKVEHWPKEDYGRFYNGDSYIILHTYKEKDTEVCLSVALLSPAKPSACIIYNYIYSQYFCWNKLKKH